jgi:hypothetical protein
VYLHNVAFSLLRLFLLGWASLVFVPCAAPADGPHFAEGEVLGEVKEPHIDEVSGVAASRNNPRVLWIHNDSGDRAQIYAINTRGDYLGAFRLGGARAFDYEDIAIGPGPVPGVSYLYVGDIGDNHAIRAGEVVVYRVAEPVVYADRGDQSRTLTGVDALRLRYPDGPRDAETLLCDPLTGSLYVISKREKFNRIYRAKAPGAGDQEIGLEMMGTMAWTGSEFLGLPLFGAVAGDVSPDGREILRKRYHTATLYSRRPDEELSRALVRPAKGIPVPCDPEQQGEAIAFDAHGRGYFSMGEGSSPSLIYYQRLSDDGPPAPLTLVPAGADWEPVAAAAEARAARPAPELPIASGDVAEAPIDEPGPVGSPPTGSFRRQFQVEDAGDLERLTLKLCWAGGAAAVYLNGRQIARVGPEYADGPENPGIAYPPEVRDTWFTLPLEQRTVTETLVSGVNSLSVEILDPPGNAAPLPFDLQLLATPARGSHQPVMAAILAGLGIVVAVVVLIWCRRHRRRARRLAGI